MRLDQKTTWLVAGVAVVAMGLAACTPGLTTDSAASLHGDGGSASALPTNDRAVSTGNIAIVGGTLVNPTGTDTPDSTVLITDGKVTQSGPSSQVKVPAGTTTINAAGKWLIPGLTDAFGSVMDAQWAAGYLYSGVTTVMNATSIPLYDHGVADIYDWPAPRTYVQPDFRTTDGHGTPIPVSSYPAVFGKWQKVGLNQALLWRDLTDDDTAAAAKIAHQNGFRVMGELALTSAPQAAADGVDALLHSTRYLITAVPMSQRQGNPLNPSNSAALLMGLNPTDPAFQQFLSGIAAKKTAVVPTDAPSCQTEVPPSPNLQPAIDMLSKAGTAQEPGGMAIPRMPPKGSPDLCPALIKLGAAMVTAGIPQIAGTATPVFGEMPGVGLHSELQTLVMKGLTPRQAIAAATSNPRQALGFAGSGCLDANCYGDVVILNADPTQDIKNTTNISDVVLAGSRLDRSTLISFPGSGP